MPETAVPIAAPPVVVTTRAGALRLTLVAAALGLFAGFLFVSHPLGLSFPVFMFATVAALFGLAALERLRPAWRNVWLVVPVVYFAVMVAVQAETALTLINLALVLGLSILIAHLFSEGDLAGWGLVDHLAYGLMASVSIGVIWPLQLGGWASHEARQPGAASPRLLAVLRGLALAVPIVVVFTMLLTAADAAFNESVREVLETFSLDDTAELTARLLVAVIAAWVCMGGLAYALRGKTEPVPATAAAVPVGRLGFTETATVLISVNALFAAFVAVQLRYFFGGQSNISVAGFTYSDYARRGFFELVIVAVFALGLGMVLQNVARRESRMAVIGFKALCVTLAGLTGVILVSAFQRLQLYEDAYGFTRLRVFSHVFMVWIGVLLAVFALTVVLSRPRLFVFGLLLALLGFAATLNVLNPDAFIAQQNLLRYQATGKLDPVYLVTLSDDALPQLLPLLDNPDPAITETVGSALHYRLNQLDLWKADAGWPGWHLASARAFDLLATRRTEIEAYEAKQYFEYEPVD